MVFERETAINNNNNNINNNTAINSNINNNINQSQSLHQYRYSNSNDAIDVEKGLTDNNNKDANNINNIKGLDNNTGNNNTKYHNINNNKAGNNLNEHSNNYHNNRKSGFKHFYYRYLNPWFKVLIVALIIMYVYSILLNIVTYRNNRFQDDLINAPRSSITFPLNDNGYRPFILPDLLFDVISPANPTGSGYKSWKVFIDVSAALFNLLFLVLVFARRDIIRFAEFVMYQLSFLFLMWFTKTFTTHPAASGIDPSCYNQTFHSFGSWIASNLGFDYCGDQMPSGHTMNVLMPMIMIKRLMWDTIGWNFKRYYDVQLTLNNNNTQNVNDNYRNDNMHNMPNNNNNDNNADENEDWFFHVHEINDSPNWVKNHPTAVWVGTIIIRVLSWFWMGIFFYALLHIRQHYTSDIMVAIIITILLTTNTKLAQALVRWAYKPNYNNYVHTGFFHQVKLQQPLNKEQINYEQRIERVGQGGVI
jgi:membrane-associated phospholipid phosphatase